MAVNIDGDNKLIVLDTTLAWNFHDIYVALMDWSAQSTSMKYLLPCQGSGKGALGGGIYTDIIYMLSNGWKLKPSGYATGTQVSVSGTLITDDGSAATVAPTVGGQPVWIFKVATNGIIAEVTDTTGLLTEDTFLANQE